MLSRKLWPHVDVVWCDGYIVPKLIESASSSLTWVAEKNLLITSINAEPLQLGHLLLITFCVELHTKPVK
jgi:hypothetical protein